MFDTFDTLSGILQVATGVLSTLKVTMSLQFVLFTHNKTVVFFGLTPLHT